MNTEYTIVGMEIIHDSERTNSNYFGIAHVVERLSPLERKSEERYFTEEVIFNGRGKNKAIKKALRQITKKYGQTPYLSSDSRKEAVRFDDLDLRSFKI